MDVVVQVEMFIQKMVEQGGLVLKIVVLMIFHLGQFIVGEMMVLIIKLVQRVEQVAGLVVLVLVLLLVMVFRE